MPDYIVKAIAAEGRIRAYAASTKFLVETARRRHNTSPVATAALGRLLTAGAMMGSMMKNENDRLTLKIGGTGPIQGLVVVANAHAEVKGYAMVPDVMLPPSPAGKLDVGGAIGAGMLSVTRTLGFGEPFTGTCELISGEIAEDLTYYYAASEQTPSSVALGVLMNKNNTVRQAGGFIIQLMPDITEDIIVRLEERLGAIKSITAMLENGMTPEDILTHILGDMGLEMLETIPAAYRCDCSRERTLDTLAGLGRESLDWVYEDKPTEVVCEFCGMIYNYEPDEVKAAVSRREAEIAARRAEETEEEEHA
ncbi:MAG: Hsp33 family molecular chaperone HslO [Ruminococcaceae bacterium]|nr:Hsp33 family molecular chaperone HslO [Oscillospiraceae bacterium]